MRKMRKLEKKIHATNPIEELPSPEHVTETGMYMCKK